MVGYAFGMDIKITDVEARVLGALIEKEITTPEYYPLSLNALVNACNQKSNREPVMNLDEDAVVAAMRALEKKEFAGPANTTDSRVRKYEHRLQEVFNFTRPETAVLCVLLLRGAQTPGEIRGRAERLHHFEASGGCAAGARQTDEARAGDGGGFAEAAGDEGVAVFGIDVGRRGRGGDGGTGGGVYASILRMARRLREAARAAMAGPTLRRETAGAWRDWKLKLRNCAGK